MGESKSKFAETFSNQTPAHVAAVSYKVENVHEQVSMSAASPSKLGKSPRPKNVALEINNRLIKPPHKVAQEVATIALEGSSLIFLSNSNPLRLLIAKIVKS
jgi:hypothetical protein